MTTVFPFDTQFQVKLLATMILTEGYYARTTFVVPENFENKPLAWTCHEIRAYFASYGLPPTPDALSEQLRKAERAGQVKAADHSYHTGIIDALRAPITDADYVLAEVAAFARAQEAKRVMVENAPEIALGDLQALQRLLNELERVKGLGMAEQAIDDFATFEKRNEGRRRGEREVRAPTGLQGRDPDSWEDVDLDDDLGGGLPAGRVGIIVAPTGAGKSAILCHFSSRAVWANLNVLVITLELSTTEVTERLDCARYGASFSDLFDDPDAIAERHARFASLFRRAHGRTDQRRILELPDQTPVSEVRTVVRQQIATGWRPQVLVIDYLDCLRPSDQRKNENAYDALGRVTRELRNLAKEFDLAVWTASQTNRAGWKAKKVSLDTIADSAKKAFNADLVVALSCTPEERRLNWMRATIVKARKWKSGTTILFGTNLAHQRIVDRYATASMSLKKVTPPAAPASLPAKKGSKT